MADSAVIHYILEFMWITKCWTRKVASLTVPDRDLEIRGAPSHLDPLMGEGQSLSVWSKNKGDPGLGPSFISVMVTLSAQLNKL